MAFYALAEYYSKTWSLDHSSSALFWIFSGYIVNVIFWLWALNQSGKLAVLSTIYGSLYAVISVILGVFVFHEQIHLTHWIGIILAVAAITLLSL
jgi:drug/metabolite transporter (DMT)-like permease